MKYIEYLRSFNAWRDDFLIEASTFLLLITFIMGTVDIFIRGSIATSQWFTVSFAIVQAISIDGLFFAVWSKIRQTNWNRQTILKNISLVFVGIILAIVAAFINLIITYQQIDGIYDSVRVMQILHIDSITLAYGRSILVVIVAVLVSLLCREYTPKKSIAPVKSLLTNKQISTSKSISANYRDKIKSTWRRFIKEGKKVRLVDIATENNIALSTVKKYSADIRKELASESI